MGKPKRHHQVPKFLLRQFAVEGRVDVLSRAGERRRASIRDVAVQEHFYSFEDEAGRRIPDLETFLDDAVDDLAAPAIRSIVAGSFNDQDLASAARFAAFQLVRSPRFRHLDELFAASLGPILAGIDAVSAWREGNDAPFNEREARRVFETGRASAAAPYTIPPDRNSHIRLMIRTAERLEGELASLEWAVAQAAVPSFVTSDSPAVVFNPVAGPEVFTGLRPGGETEVRLPLSPRHLLLGTRQRLGPASFPATEQLIVTTNRLLAASCRHVILISPGLNPPGDPRPAPIPPDLPEPTITLSPGNGQRTEPDYPPIRDAELRRIVEETNGA